MRSRVLITGGAGFIGSSVAVALAKRNYEVRVLDSLSPQIHGPDGDSPTRHAVDQVAELIHADVRNADVLTAALKGVNAVIHLAAETGTGQSMYEVGRYTDVNIMGTAKLLELLSSCSCVERIIIASSRAIYGEGKYACDKDGAVYPHQRRISDLQAGFLIRGAHSVTDHYNLCPQMRTRNSIQLRSMESPSRLRSNYGCYAELHSIYLQLRCATRMCMGLDNR